MEWIRASVQKLMKNQPNCSLWFTVYSVYTSITWVEHLRNNKNNIINCFWQSICQLDCPDSCKQNQQIDHSTCKAVIKQQCKHCFYSFLDVCWYILICLQTRNLLGIWQFRIATQLPNLCPGHQISFLSLKQLSDINSSKCRGSLPNQASISGGKPPWRYNPTPEKKKGCKHKHR